jgi:nitrate/nitrite transporter NarK
MFFLGIVPALFTLWIRRRVDEPEVWVEARRKGITAQRGLGSLLRIFEKDLLCFTLLCTLTSAFVMFAYWGLFTWMPGFLALPVEKGGAGLGIAKAPIWIIPMMVGALLGYISFGFIADKIGRRPTFAAYLVISAVLVWMFGNTHDSIELMVLGPLIGFFGSGYFSVFGAFIAELFPTRARGAAVGFCYNSGRMLSALAPHAHRFAVDEVRPGWCAHLPRVRVPGRRDLDLLPARDPRAGAGLNRRHILHRAAWRRSAHRARSRHLLRAAPPAVIHPGTEWNRAERVMLARLMTWPIMLSTSASPMRSWRLNARRVSARSWSRAARSLREIVDS